MEDKRLKKHFSSDSKGALKFTNEDRQKVWNEIKKLEEAPIPKRVPIAKRKFTPIIVSILVVGLGLFLLLPSIFPGKSLEQSHTDEMRATDVQSTPTEVAAIKESAEPYYRTTFAFEKLSGGIKSVPIEDVKAMYMEMSTVFDYVHVSEYPLMYRGYYEGDTRFVEGYEQYQNRGNAGMTNPVNVVSQDWAGNEVLTTPLKTVLLGETIFNHLDTSIEEGRNLQAADFTLVAPNEPIHVVLGHAYKKIYELGDRFSLELVSEVMDFEVVGFYKQGAGFGNESALYDENLDYTIVMPHFIPAYEPVGEAAMFQHAFHIAELTSGYIRVQELNEDIKDPYAHVVGIMEQMAERHNLEGLYILSNEPIVMD